MSIRPQTEKKLQRREAVGVIHASRFIRKYAHSHQAISMATICAIHKEIFQERLKTLKSAEGNLNN